MTTTVNRSHTFVAVKDGNQVDNVLRVERAHTFVAVQDTTQVANQLRVERSHTFAVVYNELFTAAQILVRRAHTFAVIRKLAPDFSTASNQLQVAKAMPGTWNVDVQVQDSIAQTYHEVFAVTIAESFAAGTFSNGFSNGFKL